MTELTCPECGCRSGELHELFCLKESCPFCGKQLVGCGCIKTVLKLSPEEQQIVDDYQDDSEDPLRGICKRWERAIERKGRVPYLRSAD